MGGGSRLTAQQMFQTLLPRMSELKEEVHIIKAKQLFVQCISERESQNLQYGVQSSHEQLTEQCKQVYNQRSKDMNIFELNKVYIMAMALENTECNKF